MWLFFKGLVLLFDLCELNIRNWVFEILIVEIEEFMIVLEMMQLTIYWVEKLRMGTTYLCVLLLINYFLLRKTIFVRLNEFIKNELFMFELINSEIENLEFEIRVDFYLHFLLSQTLEVVIKIVKLSFAHCNY